MKHFLNHLWAIRATTWGLVSLPVTICYLGIFALVASFPTMLEPIKQLWYLWIPPGIFLWAMAMISLLKETFDEG